MPEIRYLKITLVDGTRFILRVLSESPRFIRGVEVDVDGEEIVPRSVDPGGRPYHRRERHVERGTIKSAVDLRMSKKYATLERATRATSSARARLINIVTDTATLAAAMYPGGGLAAFNAGAYAGTKIPVRKLTGREIVTVAGTTAGAKVLADETWITDRFGKIGARQIRQLRAIVTREAGR
jgi:hypothetical protein